MRGLVVAGVLLALTGCAANQKTMTRDEFIGATQRHYDGVTEKQFYEAAEQLFMLSDGDDTAFAYPGEHAMIAQRDWSIYMVLAYAQGVHAWQISTTPTESGVEGNVYVSMQGSAVNGMPTFNGGVSTHTSPTMQDVVNAPAVYELFWSRMDYLLGKSDTWFTCEAWDAKLDTGETYGTMEPLCLALNTDDLLPEKLRPAETVASK